jgi:hypothetical protein
MTDALGAVTFTKTEQLRRRTIIGLPMTAT